MSEVVQVLLERKEAHCIISWICWLPVDVRVKTGASLTLKGQDHRWQVKEMFRRARREDVKNDWKVGGLQ